MDNQADLGHYVDKLLASGAISTIDRAHFVHDGHQHLVVVLDDTVIARFPRNEHAQASLHTEATLLNELAGQITAPIAVPFHVEADFTLHRMLHGSTTTRSALAHLDANRRARLLDQVALFVNELGTATVHNCPPSLATTSRERLTQLNRRAHEHIVPLMWQHQRDWLEELFDAIEHTSFEPPTCPIHGDLAPYHVLHDPDTGALTGVLDFGVAGLGDPAVDVACLLATWGERFCDDLLETITVGDDVVERARLLAAVLPVEWAVLAIEHNSSEMAVAHLGHAAQDIQPPPRGASR